MLSNKDRSMINQLEAKKMQTQTLSQLFGRINENSRFKPQDKEYLKQILTENINNYYKRTQQK